jgi:hypothetical protein
MVPELTLPGFREADLYLDVSKDASSDWEQFKEILVMKCQRCFDDRRVVYRVTSDVINLTVCASCAAEARILGLAVEVFSVGESKTLRARAK